MKLNQIAANQTEVTIGDNVIFFSYKTPVAAHTPTGYIKTACRWSVTTSRHINKWLAGRPARVVEQSVLDNLVA